jgi:broad specificity phosphatase PhoE
MKKIYLIRHGESEGNAGPIRQSPESPLTEKGIYQANKITERLQHLDFDLLISSPFKRAFQTAEIVSEKTGKKIIQNELFIERIRPTEQIDQPKNSEESIHSEMLYGQAFKENKKYKDGESFEEIVQRAKNALSFLEEQPNEHIVVITHGVFLKVICALVLLQNHINSENCFEIITNLKTANTGITTIEIKPNENWKLVTWNDRAHFAE